MAKNTAEEGKIKKNKQPGMVEETRVACQTGGLLE